MEFATFFDGELSWLERACLRSFVGHGHGITVFSSAELDLPAGVRAARASDVLPASRMFRVASGLHRGTVTQFANLFRYTLLRAVRTTWVDTDVLCLSPTWPNGDILLGWQDRCLVNNAVMRLPAGHPVLRDAALAAERIGDLPIWSLTGPHLLTAVALHHGLYHAIAPAHLLYPMPYQAADRLLRRDGRIDDWVKGDTLCFHLWNEILRVHGLDKRRPPDAASLLGRLLGPYL